MVEASSVNTNIKEPFRPFYPSDYPSRKRKQEGAKFHYYPVDGPKIETTSTARVATMVGTLGATALSIFALRKVQNKTFEKDMFIKGDIKSKAKAVWNALNVDYGLKEMLIVGLSALAGGLAGGLAFDHRANRDEKIGEALFQTLNIVVPTSIVVVVLKLTENMQNKLLKFGSVALSLVAGMFSALFLFNKIDSAMGNPSDDARAISLADSIVHIDDVASSLVLMKIPFAQKLQVEKFLPAIYGSVGYKTGTQDSAQVPES